MAKIWEVTKDDVITALNVNGIDGDSSMFFDVDDWDEFVDGCMSILDFDVIIDSTTRGGNVTEKADIALETIEEQLSIAGKIN